MTPLEAMFARAPEPSGDADVAGSWGPPSEPSEPSERGAAGARLAVVIGASVVALGFVALAALVWLSGHFPDDLSEWFADTIEWTSF